MGDPRKCWRLVVFLLVCLVGAACSDSPTDPEDDINPALLDGDDGMGMAPGLSASLPQGAAVIPGPGGMPMDATAEEFVQQLTLLDGTVLRSSGIYIRAVPARSVADPPFYRMAAGSALTGSLASVEPGSYTITAEWPDINFIDPVPVTYGTVKETSGPESIRATGGTFTIESVSYFPDRYPCELGPSASYLAIEHCEYQLGVIVGGFSLRATLSGGELVQEPTAFTVPIRRRTIVAARR